MDDLSNREKEIFEQALDLVSAEERRRYLESACGDDTVLLARVEALLRADEAGEEFLPERPKDTVQIISERTGDKIGRYKLLEQIGEGGFGVVWMAEQEEPVQRRVALKIIKLGMDTKQVIARFEAERQALAMMDHPSIARAFDAGATDAGRPYFVMELVRGIRITDYCDQNNLSTTERLGLFVKVCQAIQHAHQKGIIHRDMKPSNVLVTLHDGVPVPKVIDFGIAKATEGRLTDKTLFTAFQQFIGTPAYVSPEQAEMSGLDIDTRSDIYSMGVLLYELLTGQTPFDTSELVAAGLDAIRRTLREVEPPRPSTRLSTMAADALTTTAKHRRAEAPRLIHQIRGDLDWIVMKCLEKDRTRRYETANGMAQDIQRHLNNEPVLARPPSRLYEFQKSVRRHKFGFAAAAVLILVLAIGAFVSTWEAVRATRAEREQSRLRQEAVDARNNEAKLLARAQADEQKAETEAARSEAVARFMKDMLKGVGPSVALGRDATLLREILDQTAKRLDELKGQPEVEADLRQTLGMVYLNLSDYTSAEAMLQRALMIQKKLYGEKDLHVAATLHRLGQLHHRATRPTEAEAEYRQALAIQEELAGHESQEVATTLIGLGSLLRNGGNREEAEAKLREALALRRRLLPPDHPDIANSMSNLGMALNAMGKWEEAEQYNREALALRKRIFPADHPEIADSEMQLADSLTLRGKDAEAESNYLAALAIQQKVLGDHRDTALTLEKLGSLLLKENRLSEAEQRFREALAMRQKVFGEDDPTVISDKLVDVLLRQGRLAEVDALYRAETARLLADEGEESPAAAATLRAIGDKLRLRPETLTLAEGRYRDALNILRKLSPSDRVETARSVSGLSDCLIRLGRIGEARPLLEEALANQRNGAAIDDPAVALMFNNMSEILANTEHKTAEAIALMNTALKELPNSRELLLQTQAHNYRHLAFRSTDPNAAREAFQTSSEFFRQSSEHGTRHEKAMSLQAQAENFRLIGGLWERVGNYPEAREAYRQALELNTQIEAEGWARNLSADWREEHYVQLAQLLETACATETRACTPETALKLAQVLGTKVENLTQVSQHGLACCYHKLGAELRNQGYKDEANGQFVRAEEVTKLNVAGGSPPALNNLALLLATSVDVNSRNGSNAARLAETSVSATSRTNAVYLGTLAAAYAEVGQFAKAVAIQQEILPLATNDVAKGDCNRKLRLYQAGLPFHNDRRLESRSQALLQTGNFAEAEPLARECVTLREKMTPGYWPTFYARSLLGGSLLGQKKYADAEPLLRSGYEGLAQREAQIPASLRPLRLRESLQRLVQLYEATSRPALAAEWKQKLAEFEQAQK